MKLQTIIRVALILALVVTIGNIARTTLKTIESSNRVESLKSEISELQQQNSRLSRILADRNTNVFVEMVARNKLNYMRPGESLYVVFGEETDESPEEAIIRQFDAMSPLEQWMMLLFGTL